MILYDLAVLGNFKELMNDEADLHVHQLFQPFIYFVNEWEFNPYESFEKILDYYEQNALSQPDINSWVMENIDRNRA